MKGREIFSFPVHIVFTLYFLQKTLFLSFVMGSLKSHFSFFPDWPLILHFKSKKPQTLKIFSLFSCTLDYSFSWDAFFLYNSSKTRPNEKLNQKSKYSDACRDRSAYSATSWFRCSCSGRLSIYRCCCDSRRSVGLQMLASGHQLMFVIQILCLTVTQKQIYWNVLFFFISTLKNDNNKQGFLGWIV